MISPLTYGFPVAYASCQHNITQSEDICLIFQEKYVIMLNFTSISNGCCQIQDCFY